MNIGKKYSLLSTEGKIPYISLKMQSEIPIGLGETSVEETNVLLLGDVCVEKWESMSPSPQVGDSIRLNYVTLYVKNGAACCRVFDPSQVEILSQEESKSISSLAIDNEIVNARDFFRLVFAEREKINNE